MSAAPDLDRLPASTLELLTSMPAAELGARTARRWADDMLTAGVSSEVLVELAMLGDHEQGESGALLPQALRDAGIDTEPRRLLLVAFYCLLLRAWLDGRLEFDGFALLLERWLTCKPGTEGIGEDKERALAQLLETLALHRARRAASGGCPVVEEAHVTAAARTAFAHLRS